MRAFIVATTAISGVLLLLLSLASENTELFARNYPLLLGMAEGTRLFASTLDELKRDRDGLGG